MRRFVSLLTLGLAGLCACSESKNSPIDDGGPARDAAPSAQDGGPSADAGDGADAGTGEDGGALQDCEPSRSASMSVGSSGGSLSLCGASVEVSAGALTEDVMLTLRIVELPKPLPFALEQAGLAFALEIEGDLPAASEPPLALLVPHAATNRHLFFYRAGAEYQQIEACTVDDTVIGQRVAVGGTYVALVDTEDFPDSRNDLGTGTLDATFDGKSDSYDFDSGEIDTYAIYDESADGSRTYTLSATKPLPADNLAVARLTFSHAKDGSAEMIEVTYGDLNGLWSYLPFGETASEITVEQDQAGGITGTFSVELMLGEGRKVLTGSFDASAEKFRYPPSLSCGMPEG